MGASILQKILTEKRREVVQAAAAVPLSTLERQASSLPHPLGFVSHLVRTAPPAIIAEIKRASPSRGIIRADLDPVHTATAYRANGAACLSVLTDEPFFQGHLDFLPRIRMAVPDIPLLRKDFIVHPYQVWQSRTARADALLLIVAALSDEDLALLIGETLRADLDILIEVHTEEELDRAARAIAHHPVAAGRIILGINNRDLHGFQTDLRTTERIIAHGRNRGSITPETPIVAESGIHTAEDLRTLFGYGATAFLIGESLVRTGDPGQNIAALIGAYRLEKDQGVSR